MATEDKTIRYLILKIERASGLPSEGVSDAPGKVGSVYVSWLEIMIDLGLLYYQGGKYKLTADGVKLAEHARNDIPAIVSELQNG